MRLEKLLELYKGKKTILIQGEDGCFFLVREEALKKAKVSNV